ncbi:UDP-glucose 4-epimerase [Marinobacter zhanjiangensis]|uniref:UDP-glucose 4-epimerase n=1 Tax=Marinobacter zhanjiangensis TaxID=578215 RepID=A0ABQ3B2B3_9GAMM|nr:UDP-glucose 4-epimerase [Marinobacter zhanjiangensis]
MQEELASADVVVHCAARVHVMADSAADPLTEFRRVNVDGSLDLARRAAEVGVRRFVFISSVKVNGEHTDYRPPFEADEPPGPEDPYGISKREAEDGLRALARETGMEVVIVRPPLVYGPGVKGNFRSLLKLARLPIPLPFGVIENRRSLVYLENLVDFIVCVAQHPQAANETFLVSDGKDMSTTQLLRVLRRSTGSAAMLLPVPVVCFWWAGALLGKKPLVQRLCGSLQLDISKARQLLSWSPPFSVEEGLANTVQAEHDS